VGVGRGVRAVVTGGAGFVGANLVHRLAQSGHRVRVFDNLSRRGVEMNLEWLRSLHGERIEVAIGDVRDPAAVERAVRDADFVYHFAAQVAVTTSLDDPRHDFDVNASGTINVLEAARRRSTPPPVVFTSTNKVYGQLDDLKLEQRERRYVPSDRAIASAGISESRPLALVSPYGCSKGAADQYVLDYVHSYGLRAVVLRMSCIYGPHQLGNTDQGWVAHFANRVLDRAPITIYGDGRQVRDILFVEDLVDALLAAMERIDLLHGSAFNIGGGPPNAVSLLDVLDELEASAGRLPPLVVESWRAGDQRWYVSDHRAFTEQTGWSPKVSPREGIRTLLDWCAALRRQGSQAALQAEGEA
jgi:CDP-paratose 2-epimerase